MNHVTDLSVVQCIRSIFIIVMMLFLINSRGWGELKNELELFISNQFMNLNLT